MNTDRSAKPFACPKPGCGRHFMSYRALATHLCRAAEHEHVATPPKYPQQRLRLWLDDHLLGTESGTWRWALGGSIVSTNEIIPAFREAFTDRTRHDKDISLWKEITGLAREHTGGRARSEYTKGDYTRSVTPDPDRGTVSPVEPAPASEPDARPWHHFARPVDSHPVDHYDM